MLVCGSGRHCLALVAGIWAGLTYQSFARPQLAAGVHTTLLKPPYSNSSIPSLSPLTNSGSCWKCGIEAPGGIRLVYWQPDSAAVGGSNITLGNNDAQLYTQVENGFTYTSPSVYVIYSSLRGTAACSTESGLYAVGPSFSEKTIAYSSRFLAYGTLSIADAGCSEFVVVDGFHTIDFSSLYYNPITTTTTYKAGCAPYVNPRLSLPHELTNVDPRWENCEPLFYGAFDPPSVLTKASGGLAPSPVGAGQVTQPAAVAQPMSQLAPAEPAVTAAPPIAAATTEVGNNGPLTPPEDGNGGPQQTPTSIIDTGPPSVASDIPTPQANLGGASSIQVSQQQEKQSPPDEDPIGLPLAVNGNTQEAHAQASSPAQGAPQIQSSGSLGQIINSPFVPEDGDAQQVINSGSAGEVTPVAPVSNDPVIPTSHVAIPVEMGDGKPAYAVVEAGPIGSNGGAAQVAALPTAGASSDQQAAVNSEIGPDNGGAQPTTNSGGKTKVTLNDGSVAEIPTADIIQPPQQQDDQAGSKSPGPNLQSTHLSAGAFVAVPGIDGTPSSVAVQGGDYLLPKPTDDTPQQTLALLGGQKTTIPLFVPSQAVTLKGGKITNIPINAPAQAFTLQNGDITSFSPVPDNTVTLANGQVTAVPAAIANSGSSEDSANLPLQILTLQNGQATTVPIQMPSRIFTLEGGSITTIPSDTSPKVLTLANGQVSTVSSIPFTSVTLANGKVTSLPEAGYVAGYDSNTNNLPLQTLTLKNGQVTTVPIAPASQTLTLEGGKVTTLSGNSPAESLTLANGEITTISPTSFTAVTLLNGKVTSIPSDYNLSSVSGDDFLTVPDATISGKVYYTRLPIVKLQNPASNQSSVNSDGANNLFTSSPTALQTAEFASAASVIASASLPTPSGDINDVFSIATPTSKTSRGSTNRLCRYWRFEFAMVASWIALEFT